MKSTKKVYFNNLADEPQEGLRHNNLCKAYRAIRQLAGKSSSPSPLVVHKIDGLNCNSTEDVLRRWQVHYDSALNFPPTVDYASLSMQSSKCGEDTAIQTDPPTLEKTPISKLKCGRASG